MSSIVLDWMPSAEGLGTSGDGVPGMWVIEPVVRLVVGLSWLTILMLLIILATKRRDLLRPKICVLAGMVLLLTGLSSLLHLASAWLPTAGAAILADVANGIALVLASIVLARSLPQMLAAASPAELRAANSRLAAEIGERAGSRTQFEERMAERDRTNVELVAVIAEKRELTVQLERARSLAESANRVKSMFLASMSHDLRTPLNAIIGFSEMILQEVRGPIGHPKYQSYIDDIHRSGQLMLSLVNNILDLSKIEAGKYDLTPSIVDGKRIAEECIALVTGQFGGVHIAPSLTIQGDGRIYADELALRKILLNFVGNAVKFTPSGGDITVTLTQLDTGRLMTITDTGIGMDEAGIFKALEPFGQAAPDARPHGSGLGLTIVTRLVEAHGGRFTIDSAPGHGTTVGIWLPDPPAQHVSHQAVWTLVE